MCGRLLEPFFVCGELFDASAHQTQLLVCALETLIHEKTITASPKAVASVSSIFHIRSTPTLGLLSVRSIFSSVHTLSLICTV